MLINLNVDHGSISDNVGDGWPPPLVGKEGGARRHGELEDFGGEIRGTDGNKAEKDGEIKLSFCG